MKKLVIILALTCFASSQTTGSFWEGFKFGLQKDPSNPTDCIIDTQNLPNVWGNFTETLFAGEYLESLADLHDYTNKINEAINECRLQELYQKVVTSVSDSVELGVYIVRVSANFGFYGNLWDQALSDFSAGNNYEAGKNLGQLFAALYETNF